MAYQRQLQFVQEFLCGLHISSHIISEPSRQIPSEIDLGLRALIFNRENYTDFLQNSMSDAKSNTIYRFFDEYRCNYIFMRLPDEKRDCYFFIGPYLLDPPSPRRIMEKADSLGLSEEQGRQIFRLYTTFPIIEDENLLLTLSATLGNSLWGSPEAYCIEYVDYAIPDRTSPLPFSVSPRDYTDSPHSLAILEENYANEKALIDVVSQGKLHKVNVVASSVFNNGTEPRLSDSLRDRKNYLIILNTLLRKAAEYGGVHPLHIDRISSYFAREIEEVYSIHNSLSLQEQMIRDYCLLVKRHSLRNYSYWIGRAITLIHFDLLADLSLKSVAQQLGVTPSYLSGRFKKECGCTLTDYVNRKRIEKAMGLLSDTEKQVQDAAYESGIHDTNYFIRVFKKYTGMTPTQYRAQFDPDSNSGQNKN